MDATDSAYQLADRLRLAEEQLAEYQALFDVQYQRMQEATELWRAESPKERELVQPDLGALLTWLIERAELKPVSVKATVPPSLGEQPHDPADCFYHQGRPHLGPCMNAEAFTRWWWLEGPGSRAVDSTRIALATQKLVAEAFAARAQRTDWPATARKLMTVEGARELLVETAPERRFPVDRPGWLGEWQTHPCGRCGREVDDVSPHECKERPDA